PAMARCLLLLRLIVLLFVLTLVCLQPVLARHTTEELPGRVLVAVDRSDSMDIADPQRPAVDKLRLARALKLAGDLCSDEQLSRWIQQYEQSKDGLQWVAADEYPDDPRRRRELTEERRRPHDQVCQRIDALTRTQAALRVLSVDGARLLPALTKKHQV